MTQNCIILTISFQCVIEGIIKNSAVPLAWITKPTMDNDRLKSFKMNAKVIVKLWSSHKDLFLFLAILNSP